MLNGKSSNLYYLNPSVDPIIGDGPGEKRAKFLTVSYGFFEPARNGGNYRTNIPHTRRAIVGSNNGEKTEL
jgi:hypothetical protein